MFRRHEYADVISTEVAEIERRLRSLERHLARAGGRASAGAVEAADRIGDAVASALTVIGDRFRGGTRTVGADAMRFGNEAARVGNDALRRVAVEVEHRPLVALAVAAGVGFLLGLAASRR
jgi:ElaB/YqjD/DUF883 family membrane-anchored ribosome-binding protein